MSIKEMAFSADVAIHGVGFQFFNSETLLLTTKGKTIHEGRFSRVSG